MVVGSLYLCTKVWTSILVHCINKAMKYSAKKFKFCTLGNILSEGKKRIGAYFYERFRLCEFPFL